MDNLKKAKKIAAKGHPGMTRYRWINMNLGTRVTRYGVWEQVTRELLSLTSTMDELLDKRRESQAELASVERQIKQTEQHIQHLLPVAEQLDEEFGDLSEEEEYDLEAVDFREKALLMLAIDNLTGRGISDQTIRLLRRLPIDDRQYVFSKVKETPPDAIVETTTQQFLED